MNEDNSFAVFESDSPNDKTLLVVGDSFSQNLKYFMPKLYRKTVFATFDTYTEALLDEYQPDDFVYLTVERNQELFEDVETVVFGGMRCRRRTNKVPDVRAEWVFSYKSFLILKIQMHKIMTRTERKITPGYPFWSSGMF